MTLDVEARLQRAARVLDHHLDAPSHEPTYLAPAPRPSTRRSLVVSVAAFAAVLALIAVAVAMRTDERTTLSRITTADGWTNLPEAPIGPRYQHLTVSTGAGLFVWGGYFTNNNRDGAYFDSGDRSWRTLPDAPLARDRGDAIGVWTGREVIVINGIGPVRAAAFDPITFTWRALPDPPLANAANAMNRAFFMDDAVIVVGVASEGDGHAPSQVARLDLATSVWSIEPSAPVEFSSFFSAVSTNDEIIVVAQRPNRKDACGSIVLAFRPSSHSWREIASGPTADRVMPVVVWTGSELFVGGGMNCGNHQPSVAGDLLDPTTGAWRRATDAPMGFEAAGRYGDLWTGNSVATITGNGTPLLYNPVADAWHAGSPPYRDTQFGEQPSAWVVDSIVLFGVAVSDGPKCCDFLGGVSYRPPPGW